MGYQAKYMPRFVGRAGWNAILPARQNTAALEADITADFVVIGGGFAGLSAARRLRQLQPEANIVLLEAGSVGESTAGRNSGFMIDLPHELSSENYAGESAAADKANIALNRAAIQFAKDAAADYEMADAWVDPAGKINGAASAKGEAHNISYQEHLQTLGEASTMLDAQQMRELTGSSYYCSGLYTAGTVMIQPAAYVRALADGLVRDGVSLFEHSPVQSFDKQGESWKLATPKGTVSTSRIVLAVNGHLESFGFERGRLMHLFLFATMTEELDAGELRALGGQSRWGITPADPMGTTMRRIDTAQGGNRIVTRTCASFEPDLATSERQMARAARVMRKKFDDRFAQLAGKKMAYGWAGHLCLSRNSVSVMREIEQGVFAACCQNGLGTVRGTMTGIAAAELAAGESSNFTKSLLQEAEPKALPPRPFSTIGANAYLRLKEFQAGAE